MSSYVQSYYPNLASRLKQQKPAEMVELILSHIIQPLFTKENILSNVSVIPAQSENQFCVICMGLLQQNVQTRAYL